MSEKQEKTRLDVILGKLYGYSREAAKEQIENGNVFVNKKLVTSAGVKFCADVLIEHTPPKTSYVSRGGYKLEKAIRAFNIDVKNKVCIDIGASTGGFTDCLLQNGAAFVYAVDSGSSQFSEKLKNDNRILNLEGVNAKSITTDLIGKKVDFACVDVSFISLLKVILPVSNVILKGGSIVCLIKPQFEAGRKNLNKKGVVKDKKVHEKVINNIQHFFSQNGLLLCGLIESPIKGQNGNIEYLAYCKVL